MIRIARRRIHFLLAGLVLLVSVCAHAQVSLIPKPLRATVGDGYFVLDRHSAIVAPGEARAQEIATFAQETIEQETGIALTRGHGSGHGQIELRVDPEVKGEEAYRLRVARDGVVIAASSMRGLFWGVQTLRQLLPVQKAERVEIPAIDIEDAPQFSYRGQMFDVGRHFFPVEFVKKQIDLLSYYKINTFRWHLTEDQGWRIEIKKYPRLTEVGAWRIESDGSRYGGFYTQEQIRDVVEYARLRNIMVIPEIEMPGHSSAALAAYPELSCGKRPIDVPAAFGVMKAGVYCVGYEGTFAFLQDVLDEVVALFPAPYVHIGGDEVPKDSWSDCPSCRQRMRDEHLQDAGELQSYFVKRIQRYLASKGKTLIGWDEILEGGADKSAIVEMWRGDDEARKALLNGNRLISAGPFYLDQPIEAFTLEDVYRTDAFADSIYAEHRERILGAEAPLWTEYITPLNAEAMLYPRLQAFAERLWNADAHDYADFKRRLQQHYRWMNARQIAYGPEGKNLVDYQLSFNAAHTRWRIRAARGFDDIQLHYTTDGSEPAQDSPAFADVLDLHAPAKLKVAPFRNARQVLPTQIVALVDNKALGKPVSYANPPSGRYHGTAGALADGILGSTDFHDGTWVGWQGVDLGATIDLQRPVSFTSIAVNFLQQSGSWILLPRRVTFLASTDGQAWTRLQVERIDADSGDPKTFVRKLEFVSAKPINARFVRVEARKYGELPTGHDGAGGEAWIFADEVVVR
ncbi:glycoside hydrolase family 20 protein [Dokdonella soli]|uniref:beta-N-acetylhexosaminidase n=1 Tax=Dokdonella soli TaxID=529810 RepID=A0ABN1IV51_9GAMM